MSPWLIPFAIPTYVQTALVFLLSFPFWERPIRPYGGFIIARWRPWFAVRWKYTTTLGFMMGTHDPYAVSDQLLMHETIHAYRQYVDLNVLAFVLAGCLLPWLGWVGALVLWGTSGMLWLVPNFFTGWVRFGDAYMGSEHERSAYAQTKGGPWT